MIDGSIGPDSSFGPGFTGSADHAGRATSMTIQTEDMIQRAIFITLILEREASSDTASFYSERQVCTFGLPLPAESAANRRTAHPIRR